MGVRGAFGGVLVFWDNKVLELVGREEGEYLISCRFKNCEDGFFWVFIRVYRPILRREREGFRQSWGP